MAGKGRLQKKKKRIHGHRQWCGDCGGGGCTEVEEGIRGISGNAKNMIKIIKYMHVKNK